MDMPEAGRMGVPGMKSEAELASLSDKSAIDEGKTLYKNDQPMQALNRFMMVLKRDPRNNEARKYLRIIVEDLRKKPIDMLTGKEKNLSPQQQAENQARLQKRFLLTLDLKGIPQVKLTTGKRTYLEIERGLLFAEKSGGLKEEGIPLLDRISAWLTTFGLQPVVVHIYPDEVEDPSTNGGLFLQRYAAIYGFFVDERKLPAVRFVSADLLADDPFSRSSKKAQEGFEADTTTPRVVIETIGSGAYEPALEQTIPPEKTKWLEMSLFSNRASFDPQEGEWSTIDLAAVTRSGIRKWNFKIIPDKDPNSVVHFEDGKSNVLKRFTWEGRDQKSGSFLPPGLYTAKLTATDADNTTMTRDQMLEIRAGNQSMLSMVGKPPSDEKVFKNSKKGSKKKKSKRGAASDPVDSATPAATAPASDPFLDAVEKAVPGQPSPADAVTQAQAAGASSDDTGNQAIWKQVVQFEKNASEIPATVRSTLERIAKTLEVYPLQKVRITGYAHKGEKGGSTLAKQRAQSIRQMLLTDFKVDKARVLIGGGKVIPDTDGARAEISITN